MRITRLRTIRIRLTLAATAVTLMMLAIAALVTIAIQREALTAGIDDALRQRADNLEPIDPGRKPLPGEGDSQDSFVQLIDGKGRVVAATDNVSGAPAVVLPTPDVLASSFATVTVDQPAGRYRVHIRQEGGTTNARYLIVGKNIDDVTDSVRILSISLAAASPALDLLLGILAWWLTGRMLRPVEAIRKGVEGIHGDELHRRVPVPKTEDEIARLARTMNSMLDRVEASSVRQQQFVDDASHELRTPLTRMVTDLEVAIAHPGGEPLPTILGRLVEHTTNLSQLLNDLLYLARSPHDREVAEEVDLDDIAIRVAQRLRGRFTIAIDTTGVGAARVIGDDRALERAVTNLLDNAMRHARTRVAVSTSTIDDTCRVTVDDDGTGIPPVDRDRVLERFVRLDESRSRTDGGAGLGLAIVNDITIHHRGHVDVTTSHLGGARVILLIPAADGSSGDDCS